LVRRFCANLRAVVIGRASTPPSFPLALFARAALLIGFADFAVRMIPPVVARPIVCPDFK
jgi:hypothetical protein